MAARQTVDARGAFCPGPLMELIAALRFAAVGEEVEVWSTDQGSAKDIPEWVKKARHALVSVERKDGYWSLVVRKAR
jgi:tRNA 2-thiouridine synthesizing protein A